MADFDFIVIGAGMAGASASCELAAQGRLLMLEQEDQPGYHTTGRSAALYAETYGNATVRGLTTGGKPFYLDPPAGFAAHPLLLPRGVVFIGRADQRRSLDAFLAEVSGLRSNIRRIAPAEVEGRVPVFRPGYVADAVLDPDAMDIDVHGLHQGYLKGMRARGGQLLTDARVTGLARQDGRWRVESKAGSFSGRVIVNAAGAWADEIGSLAGAAPIGLVPKRRTAIQFRPPAGMDVMRWPTIIDADEQFYFRPDAGKLMASPADETPMPPCDVQPEDLDIAILVDRLEQAVTMPIPRIEHRWAGLRSFVADKTPVVGYDERVADFFWLAGQGGYGIQTAPGIAKLVAALAQRKPVPQELADLGVTEAALSPARLRR
ncbi:FAD-dependent catabolic D-arginine dehydrogenase DauA [Hypericibacter adhaerens]|jgi:D-arginine dehydrogenase|uniref:FAD-dependent catabolic D-arginine dehydrogenase DauA n=1 Tax=Hypericibacter adhaerens TaxID=2602016 RepID=A0A5J6N073_9PROT|nr:FAD-binding oxidoreductase [Hypericibacter adhaerens]QEX23408.1 FAD-dependent catabolic D-arginine dehydrogenase DauA [Hypericibacter adhaerens]HVY52140.1 FAD-binding oxidoreductase [Devosia sp.]